MLEQTEVVEQTLLPWNFVLEISKYGSGRFKCTMLVIHQSAKFISI